MNSGVYKITNLTNDKIYIGSAANGFKARWQKHKSDLKLNKHRNQKLQKAYNKYGKDVFVFEILAKCPPEYVIKLEQYFIDSLKPFYNICLIAGSSLGVKRSAEYKEKLSKSRIGYKASNEFCENQSKRMIGNSITAGRKLSDEHKAKVIATGRTHAKETKEKMRIAQTGKIYSEDVIKNMSVAKCKYIYTIKNVLTGETASCNNLRLFAQENKLHDGHLFETLAGKNGQGKRVIQHKGFKLLSQDLNINAN